MMFAVAGVVLALLLGEVAESVTVLLVPFAVGGFDPLLPHDADNGFPSDHSLLAAAFVAVALPYKKWGGMSMMPFIFQ